MDRESVLILADYVTLDAGTGTVHTAPGHGQEDYESGLEYGLEIYSPVDDQGKIHRRTWSSSPGKFVFDANDDGDRQALRIGELLLQHRDLHHQYPHCWRCKNPIIFRATEQWFISMEKNDLRKKALDAIDRVRWIPTWGHDRIYGMIENRPDWCISRQRAWGVPIIVFLLRRPAANFSSTRRCLAHVAGLFEKGGADVWFDLPVKELLPAGTRLPQMRRRRIRQGRGHPRRLVRLRRELCRGLREAPQPRVPADMYLEGSDQHRGWFHSSLLASVGTRGDAPYQSVLTHGFVVDGEGRKMSKSLGNVIAPEEVIDKLRGRDPAALGGAEDYRDDIRISEEILYRLSEAYRRIRNTCRFLLGNLYDFDPTKTWWPDEMLEIDRFVLKIRQLRRGSSSLRDVRISHHLPHPPQLLRGDALGVLPRHPEGPALHRAPGLQEAEGGPERDVPDTFRHRARQEDRAAARGKGQGRSIDVEPICRRSTTISR